MTWMIAYSNAVTANHFQCCFLTILGDKVRKGTRKGWVSRLYACANYEVSPFNAIVFNAIKSMSNGNSRGALAFDKKSRRTW